MSSPSSSSVRARARAPAPQVADEAGGIARSRAERLFSFAHGSTAADFARDAVPTPCRTLDAHPNALAERALRAPRAGESARARRARARERALTTSL